MQIQQPTDLAGIQRQRPPPPIVDKAIIDLQPTINVGTIGHVAHGKSTIVLKLSGVKTQKHSSEEVRNITIKLGYANAKIWKCESGNCEAPQTFAMSPGHARELACKHCEWAMTLVRHISFVDCPGHDVLMATMLNGAAVMDGAMLVMAASDKCPQPQTAEHLAATEILGLRNFVCVQSKIDLVSKEQAAEHHKSIRDFLCGTVAEGSPVVPVCGYRDLNLDVLAQYLAERIPDPVRDLTSPPLMSIIRSFDINKPGTEPHSLRGGVVGGTIRKGVLRVGDVVEIRPGILRRRDDAPPGEAAILCIPLITRVSSLLSEKNALKLAVPGGLIGVGTLLDPVLTRNDRLVGQVLGLPGSLPDIYADIELQCVLMREIVGALPTSSSGSSVAPSASKLKKRLQCEEIVKLNVGSMSVSAQVTHVRGKCAQFRLHIPACMELGSKVTISRSLDKHWRLVGWGRLLAGKPLAVHVA